MRVVIDTNILVSFAIRPSKDFEKVFDHIAAHGVTLVSQDTVSELFTVLSRDKFSAYLSQGSVITYVEWYIGISESVTVIAPVAACRDPKDDKFLALAVAGKADCIIAGDQDLLDMRSYEGILIYRAREFIDRFIQQSDA